MWDETRISTATRPFLSNFFRWSICHFFFNPLKNPAVNPSQASLSFIQQRPQPSKMSTNSSGTTSLKTESHRARPRDTWSGWQLRHRTEQLMDVPPGGGEPATKKNRRHGCRFEEGGAAVQPAHSDQPFYFFPKKKIVIQLKLISISKKKFRKIWKNSDSRSRRKVDRLAIFSAIYYANQEFSSAVTRQMALMKKFQKIENRSNFSQFSQIIRQMWIIWIISQRANPSATQNSSCPHPPIDGVDSKNFKKIPKKKHRPTRRRICKSSGHFDTKKLSTQIQRSRSQQRALQCGRVSATGGRPLTETRDASRKKRGTRLSNIVLSHSFALSEQKFDMQISVICKWGTRKWNGNHNKNKIKIK